MRKLVEMLGGSHLYGTNTAESDEDLRGVVYEPLETLLTTEKEFEQLVSVTPDTVYYGLKKFCRLALQGNPNIIELLFCPLDLAKFWSEPWQQLYDVRHQFLSQTCYQHYVGYAYGQIGLIERHMKGDIQRLSHAKFVMAHGYDTKAAAHTMRLLFQCADILRNGDFSPRLEGDQLKAFMNIRGGALTYEEFKRLAETVMFKTAQIESKLPKQPNRKLVNDILFNIYRDYINEGI